MKSILMAILLAAAPAMAIDYNDVDQDQSTLTYLSWCDNNNVISQNSEGQLSVQANCTEAGLQCKTTQIYRVKKDIVFATCEVK